MVSNLTEIFKTILSYCDRTEQVLSIYTSALINAHKKMKNYQKNEFKIFGKS
jgi:predicted transcriptional regulator